MSARHWFLVAGFLLALIALWSSGGDTSLSDLTLVFAGSLMGIWAIEDVHAHAREHGIDLDPL